ncbi:MAG: YbjN domain-containing protein [Dermatophilus congolensis]|nr:YbjN domain-containing protein [Dermatophilus congolensis]
MTDRNRPTSPSAERATSLVLEFSRAQGLEVERGDRKGELVIVLPGEQKLRTVCSLLVGEQDVSVSAFVIRNPDENHAEVYTYLLRRNLRMPGMAYAIDSSGDVYVVGRVPHSGLDSDQLDRMLGLVLEAADGAFNELLTLGFLSSMKREWAWRTSRRESLRNLEAFRHLLDGSEDEVEQPGGAELADAHESEKGRFDTPGRAHDRTSAP